MRYPHYLLLVIFTGSVSADDSAASLSVQPKLCIVDQRTPRCDVTFNVEWTSPEPGHYCIKREKEDEPLRCWVDKDAGELDDKREVSKTFYYQLQEDGATRVSAKVEVLRMDSDDRRRRRRTRHVWDVL